MKWIDQLDAKFGRWAVPNVTLFLIAGQVLTYLASSAPEPLGPRVFENIMFAPDMVAAGEWWRLVTFLFTPPTSNPLFAFFFWYLFYLMGMTLEANWGAFRYNVYLILGYVASVAMAFVAWGAGGAGGQIANNALLYSTVFLAFARQYPEFTLYIFFILPIKIRWLALVTWIMYGVTMIFSQSWLERALVAAAVFNYLVFFGRDIVRDMRHRHRRMQFQSKSLQGKGKNGPRGRKMAHECHVCGLSSVDSPRTQFRYCSECGGDVCYCPEHLGNHEHVQEEIAGGKSPK